VNILIYPKVKLEASIGPKVFMMGGDSIEYKYSFILPDHDFYQPSLHIQERDLETSSDGYYKVVKEY